MANDNDVAFSGVSPEYAHVSRTRNPQVTSPQEAQAVKTEREQVMSGGALAVSGITGKPLTPNEQAVDRAVAQAIGEKDAEVRKAEVDAKVEEVIAARDEAKAEESAPVEDDVADDVPAPAESETTTASSGSSSLFGSTPSNG